MSIEQVKSMIQQATVVVIDGASYRVDYCEDDYFHATDEEDGNEVNIEYDEIDLSRDSIFQLTLMNPVKAAYEDGRCPDCGSAIPDGIVDGESCDNCGHVFCTITPDNA
jgi:hypothetical protein